MLQDVGLGILNWKCYETLRASLESHKRGGLAESMQSKYVLLLENDWQLIKKFDEVKRQLSVGLDLLESGRAIQICYRDRFEKNRLIDRFDRSHFYYYFPQPDSSIFRKFICFVRRLLRPRQQRGWIGLTRYMFSHPEKLFHFIEYDEKIDFLFYPSKYQSWSNQPFLINRNFFIGEILFRVESLYTPKKFLVNGFKCIERELLFCHRYFHPPLHYIFPRKLFSRGSWWSKQNFKIATSNSGLFAHARIGYRGY